MADCTGPRVMPMPGALGANRTFFDEAVSVAGQMYAQVWQGNPQENLVLAAPVLLELQRFAEQQLLLGSGAQRLALWGCHDTFITTLLVALGVWDGVWPGYSHTLVLEIYRATKAGLCDLSKLVSAEVGKWAEDTKAWSEYCYGPSGSDETVMATPVWPRSRQVAQTGPMSLSLMTGAAIAFVSFVIGLVFGRRVQAQHDVRQRQSLSATLLS